MGKLKKSLAFVFLLLVGLYFTVTGFSEFATTRDLAAKGSTTVGEIVERDTDSGGKSSSDYYLTVRFQIEAGKTITRRMPVRIDDYMRAASTPKIQIHYLAKNPKICAAGNSVEVKHGDLVTGFFMMAGAVFLLIFFKEPWEEIPARASEPVSHSAA